MDTGVHPTPEWLGVFAGWGRGRGGTGLGGARRAQTARPAHRECEGFCVSLEGELCCS